MYILFEKKMFMDRGPWVLIEYCFWISAFWTAIEVEFNSGGSSNTDSGKVTGSLETKYKCADYGMTFTEKWSTDNSLATTIELADKPLKGAKLVFDSTFSPQTGNFVYFIWFLSVN